MIQYIAEPEVAGELGTQSDVDYTIHPPIVKSVEYLFHGWLGDELVEAFPCFIATSHLAEDMLRLGLTGFRIKPVKISISEEFKVLYPDRILPDFVWLEINKDISGDLGLIEPARLVVSERFRRLFGNRVSNMDFEQLPSEVN